MLLLGHELRVKRRCKRGLWVQRGAWGTSAVQLCVTIFRKVNPVLGCGAPMYSLSARNCLRFRAAGFKFYAGMRQNPLRYPDWVAKATLTTLSVSLAIFYYSPYTTIIRSKLCCTVLQDLQHCLVALPAAPSLPRSTMPGCLPRDFNTATCQHIINNQFCLNQTQSCKRGEYLEEGVAAHETNCIG